jgi:hypothetical protein
MLRIICTILLVFRMTSGVMQAQFAHTQGKEIVDGSGKQLLRDQSRQLACARRLHVAPE